MGFLGIKQGKYAKKRPSYFRTLVWLFVLVALVAVLLLNLFTHVLSVVQYYGNSMEPALHDRQILVVQKTDKVEQGDIAAFYYNNKILVRRIVAEGGTSIEMEEPGIVYIDNQRLEEDYVQNPAIGQCNINFPFTVPYDEFFVMGDNRTVSMDSRLEEIGTIPRNRILGKVIFSLG